MDLVQCEDVDGNSLALGPNKALLLKRPVKSPRDYDGCSGI